MHMFGVYIHIDSCVSVWVCVHVQTYIRCLCLQIFFLLLFLSVTCELLYVIFLCLKGASQTAIDWWKKRGTLVAWMIYSFKKNPNILSNHRCFSVNHGAKTSSRFWEGGMSEAAPKGALKRERNCFTTVSCRYCCSWVCYSHVCTWKRRMETRYKHSWDLAQSLGQGYDRGWENERGFQRVVQGVVF